MITAFKKAEDGDGYILRIYEVSGKPAQARLEFPLLKISEAWFTDGVERNLEKILIKDPDIKTSLGAYEIKTIRIKGGLK
jgi:alpha-mannosidase